MNRETKTTLGVLGGIFGVNILGSIIYAVCDKHRKKEAEKQKMIELENELKKSSKSINATPVMDDFFGWSNGLNDMKKILDDMSEKEKIKNTARFVRCLYAIIKQRKTLMKSEEEFVVHMVRHNKLFENEVDLENITDQDLRRFLETKCVFEIVDNIPILKSEKNTYKFCSLTDLGIEAI